jgi:2-dehydro-3-deoxyglucarate aldolase/4-hydroxy-2-oxoheptanedioate aldolase
MMLAVGGRCPCLVRCPWNDSVWIKQILDLGCDGIIIPQIQSAAAAKQAVQACRYPPQGIRSVGVARAQQYGLNLQPYVDHADADLTVILQVEHLDGVAQIDAILDVAGFDAILIGPYDLSASMGLVGQVSHPDVQAAIEKIKAACRRREIPIGIFAADVGAAQQQIQSGVRLIALGTDALFLGRAAQQALASLAEN